MPGMDRVLCRLLLPADFLRVPTASAVFSVPPTISQRSVLSLNGVRMTTARSLLSVLPPLVQGVLLQQVVRVLPPQGLEVLPPQGLEVLPPLVVPLLLEVREPLLLEARELPPPPVQVVTRLLARPLLLPLPPPPQLLPRRQEQARQAKLEQRKPVEQPRVVQRKQAVVDGKVEAEASEYDDLLELRTVFAGVG